MAGNVEKQDQQVVFEIGIGSASQVMGESCQGGDDVGGSSVMPTIATVTSRRSAEANYADIRYAYDFGQECLYFCSPLCG